MVKRGREEGKEVHQHWGWLCKGCRNGGHRYWDDKERLDKWHLKEEMQVVGIVNHEFKTFLSHATSITTVNVEKGLYGGTSTTVMPNLHNSLILAAYIVIFFIGLPANLLALRAFVGRVRQPDPAPIHILLLSLTLADLLLLLLLPFKIIEAASDFRWYLPKLVCALMGFGFYSSTYCSTWLLAGISLERYLGVAFPVRYKLSRRPLYGVIAVLVAWTLSFGHCTVVIVVQYLNSTQRATDVSETTCYVNFTREQLRLVLPVRLELCLVLFFIPMVVTIFCYWRFVWIMLTQPHVGAQRRRRAVGLAVVSLLNFLVCFGPYNISHLVGFHMKESPKWRAEAVVFSSLNAGLDPLLFYFSSSVVRRTFGKGLQALRHQGSSLLGCRGRQTAEVAVANGDRGVSQAEGGPSSDFTTD
ncbi:free fatty acid receptor 2 [Camelus ferus]|nr:free fatty acid receptor 2 [Camelus ferus]